MKVKYECFVDTYRNDEEDILKNAVAMVNSFKSPPKYGIEDVVTKLYYFAVNVNKIYVVVSDKDKLVLGLNKLYKFDRNYLNIWDGLINPFNFTISLQVAPSNLKESSSICGIQRGSDVKHRSPSLFMCGDELGSLHYDSYGMDGTRISGKIPNVFVAENEPVQITWVKSGNKFLFYRDRESKPLAVVENVPNELYINSNYYFGQVSGKTFKGLMDNIQVYDEALSPLEIDIICNGKNVPNRKIALFLNFDGANPFEDLSGNGRNAHPELSSEDRVVSSVGNSNLGENLLKVTSIKDYPLERLPSSIVEHIEFIIKPEYNLSNEEILNASQFLLEQKVNEIFPKKIPVLKIVNYTTKNYDSLVLPSIFDDVFICNSDLCNRGVPRRGKIVVDNINQFEAKNTDVVTGFVLSLGDAVDSTRNLISELRFFDISGKEIKYKITTKTKYGNSLGWGNSNLYDDDLDSTVTGSAIFYNGKESEKIVIELDEPSIIGRAFICYGGSSSTPSTLKITDSNGLVRFEKSESDGNIRKSVHKFVFIGNE